MSRESIGERIKALRKARRWSQRKLGLRSHVSNVTISKIENGQTQAPGVDILGKLAEGFELPLAELIRGVSWSLPLEQIGPVIEVEGNRQWTTEIQVNMQVIRDLDPDEYAMLLEYIAGRRRKVERDHGIKDE